MAGLNGPISMGLFEACPSSSEPAMTVVMSSDKEPTCGAMKVTELSTLLDLVPHHPSEAESVVTLPLLCEGPTLRHNKSHQ